MHADGKPDGMPNNKGCSFSTEKAKKVDPRPIDLTLLLLFYTHTHLRTIALAKSLVISNDFRLDLVSPIYTKKRSYFFFSVLKTRFLFFFFFPKARTPFFFGLNLLPIQRIHDTRSIETWMRSRENRGTSFEKIDRRSIFRTCVTSSKDRFQS